MSNKVRWILVSHNMIRYLCEIMLQSHLLMRRFYAEYQTDQPGSQGAHVVFVRVFGSHRNCTLDTVKCPFINPFLFGYTKNVQTKSCWEDLYVESTEVKMEHDWDNFSFLWREQSCSHEGCVVVIIKFCDNLLHHCVLCCCASGKLRL